MTSNIAYEASISNGFAKVNNPASMDHAMNELGVLVRSLRLEQGLSQEQLGERVEMSQRWISTIETKEDYVPRHANLVKLAAALSTDIAPFYVAADLVKSRVAAQKLAEAMDVPVEDPRFGIHKMIGDVDIEDALSLHDDDKS